MVLILSRLRGAGLTRSTLGGETSCIYKALAYDESAELSPPRLPRSRSNTESRATLLTFAAGFANYFFSIFFHLSAEISMCCNLLKRPRLLRNATSLRAFSAF